MSTSYKLMLVDDDADDQYLFLTALNSISSNIHCHCYQQPEQGMKVLMEKEENPDIIFLDLNMPLMDGFTFLYQVKNNEVLKHIPVVIYTTSSRDMDKQKAIELGALEFISKPNTLEDLKQNIHSILKKL